MKKTVIIMIGLIGYVSLYAPVYRPDNQLSKAEQKALKVQETENQELLDNVKSSANELMNDLKNLRDYQEGISSSQLSTSIKPLLDKINKYYANMLNDLKEYEKRELTNR